jgi:hypothetical protein
VIFMPLPGLHGSTKLSKALVLHKALKINAPFKDTLL